MRFVASPDVECVRAVVDAVAALQVAHSGAEPTAEAVVARLHEVHREALAKDLLQRTRNYARVRNHQVLQALVDQGNTVIVIEHNLEVIKTADFIVDLGPGGGHNGGQIVATGTPEDVALNPESYTGTYLAKYLPLKKRKQRKAG